MLLHVFSLEDSIKTIVLQIQVGDKIETVRFFHCYKRGVDRVFVDHPLFLEKVSIQRSDELLKERLRFD